jgi:hypothetical protein
MLYVYPTHENYVNTTIKKICTYNRQVNFFCSNPDYALSTSKINDIYT